MATTTSDVIVDTLIRWDVDTVFGIPGDGINGLIEAFRKRRDEIRFIQTRHEESAAFMACGYAKYTGKLGVCCATSGPGGIHLLNGLYDAKLDGAPVLALTGLQFSDLIGTLTQQDVPLDKLFQDVAVFNERVMKSTHARNLAVLACRTALARKGVAHITIPVDVQDEAVTESDASKRNIPGHNTDMFEAAVKIPPADHIRRAADLLNAGERVVIMAGRGALGAGDELERVAELTGGVICKALLGKAAVPDDSPYTTGQIGLLGTTPSQEALESCDTLLIVGSSFPYIEFYPAPGQARGVQIDQDPGRIGLRYPVELGLVGDARATLEALIPLLHRNTNRDFLSRAQAGMAEWTALMEQRGQRTDSPMKPQVVALELGRRLADNAIVSCDSGTIATWWARQIPVRKGQMHSLSGNLATMAPGLPYTIAAQLAYPDRPCVAFVGDGGLSMLMAEIATAVKYALPIKVFVINNRALGQIKWEQMVFLGNPEYVCDLQAIDFAKVAEACGATGITVRKAEECGSLVEAALKHPGPVVVDCIVDPHEPPMPPKVKPAQALHFAEALVRGTPAARKIALTTMSNTVRELI